jgi:hypothetical protein
MLVAGLHLGGSQDGRWHWETPFRFSAYSIPYL